MESGTPATLVRSFNTGLLWPISMVHIKFSTVVTVYI